MHILKVIKVDAHLFSISPWGVAAKSPTEGCLPLSAGPLHPDGLVWGASWTPKHTGKQDLPK